ncbi:helix-turn-helix domain-containing protein [Pseudalkalibacillus sp. A8]|uniref:helix-turn-helix domain-containing protein n=1 Tax=Pseudalkalibacillus sp. A8 TaxID=3382641 RepID=UPI0038B4DDAD
MASNLFNNNKKVSKLFSINKILTKSLDINTILRTLVEAAKELIEVSDTIILYLYEPDENVLKVAEGVGIDIKVMKNISFSPGESLTGMTFTSRQSHLFAYKDEIEEHMTSMTENNYHYYYKGVYERKIKSAFCVPLIHQDQCLGVLVVDNFENDGVFTEEDMEVIKVIADQSAIAIVNSNLFQDIKSKNEQLEHSLDIHEKFTKVILDGGGIETILSLLSRIISTKVTYVEQKSIDDDSNLYSIVHGKEVLGYFLLDKKLSSLSSINLVAVEHAATALTLELVRQNAQYEKELHFREELFQQLMDGTPVSEVKRFTNALQYNSQGEFVCMILEGKHDLLWKPSVTLEKERFIRLVEKICYNVCKSNFVFTKAFQTILIIPVDIKENVEKIVNKIEEICSETKEIVYGIGREVPIQYIQDSYREALDAVRYGKINQNEKFIDYSKLGIERLLQKIDETTLEYYVSDKLGPLLSMEQEYVDTLGKLIETNKNHKLTAEQLYIHPNTLYRRIKKIERTMNISLDQENDWINVVIAYQIHVARHTV